MLVISPHYDDAVFSAGALLAGSGATVCTVYGGAPADGLLTAYDAACGFQTSAEAVSARERENARALLVLGCEMRSLVFLDGQYAEPPHRVVLSRYLAEEIDDDPDVVAPLGILHADHVRVSDHVVELRDRCSRLRLYEELPYRVDYPEFTLERIASLRDRGLALARLPVDGDQPLKRAAVACYRSQLPDIENPALFVAERLWEVVLP